MKKDPLLIAGKKFSSRFLLGTGKFRSKREMQRSIMASGTQLVTVALRRIDLNRNPENILAFIPDGIKLLVNTSGARTAAEAVRIARIARAARYSNWIKIEVINDTKYLLPDNAETIKATRILAAEGFVVLPYLNPDLYTARQLVKAGAAAVMPLGSLIGSNEGLKTKKMLEILISEIREVPIIIDAGIGRPSQAAAALEMGAAAVLVNTAVAVSKKPVQMAQAFAQAVAAGRLAFLARLAESQSLARASSPLRDFLEHV